MEENEKKKCNITLIKYLLWDIDGTLLNFDLAEALAMRKCFRKFHLGICSDKQLQIYREIDNRYWNDLENGKISKKEVLEGRFREFFTFYNIDCSIISKFNEAYQMCIGNIACYNQNAEYTVKTIKKKYMQYGVTNGTIVAQQKRITKSGLDELLQDVFISEEIGFNKPSVNYFKTVFEKIGSNNPGEYLIIGDSLSSDIKGGKNVGIKTCWYNPTGKKNDTNCKADYEIRDLKEVIDILFV